MGRSSANWKRVGKKSGPANVLLDRWHVLQLDGEWIVKDLATNIVGVGTYPTMRLARRRAETYAREAGAHV